MRRIRSAHGRSSVEDAVLSETGRGSSRSVVVQAGHMILSDQGPIWTPEDGAGFGVLEEFGVFSVETWRVGCSIVRRLKDQGDQARLMILVNDWQYLSSGAESRRGREQAIAKVRKKFFESVRELPRSHRSVMEEFGLGSEDLELRSAEQLLFSETELRIALAGLVKELFREGAGEELGLECYFSPSGDPIVEYVNDFAQPAKILYCGQASCAGEVAALLKELVERDVGVFINLFPSSCWGQVLTGTEVGSQLFVKGRMRVVNVGFEVGSQRAVQGGAVMESCVA